MVFGGFGKVEWLDGGGGFAGDGEMELLLSLFLLLLLLARREFRAEYPGYLYAEEHGLLRQ